jgi:hypothetical protein
MARVKTTVSIDADTLSAACGLLGSTSTSEVVDVALARYVRSERLLRDLRGYLAVPPSPEEVLLGDVEVQFDLDDDDVDYDQFYGSDDDRS